MDGSNKTIGCFGHFNTIHPGHQKYLRYCEEQGKKIILFLQDESFIQKIHRPDYYSVAERYENVKNNMLVDNVVVVSRHSFAEEIIKRKVDVLVLGSEHQDSHESYIEEVRRKVPKIKYFKEGYYNFSSLPVEFALELEEKKFFKTILKLCTENRLGEATFFNFLKKMKATNIGVIGDAIVDTYTDCVPLGMSSETPLVVVKEAKTQKFIGGSGVVALHLSYLSDNVSLITSIGNDPPGDFIFKQLENFNVKPFLEKDPQKPTTEKVRYTIGTQKIFRLSRLDETPVGGKIEKRLLECLAQEIDKVDSLLVSDFSYGVLTPKIIDFIISKARDKTKKIYFLGDVQCSSQIGDITRLKNFHTLFPTEKEARVSLRDETSSKDQLAQRLFDVTQSENIVLKLGADGFILYETKANGFVGRYHIPALTKNPVDVTGAGDTLMAAFAAALTASDNILFAAIVGGISAGIAVKKFGNKATNFEELKSNCEKIFK